MNVGIVGLGAIGGPVAARLLRSRQPGETIALGAGSERNVAALRAGGLRVEQEGDVVEVAAPGDGLLAASLPRLERPYDVILLCTRTDALEAALQAAAPLLAADGALVCLQNGLPEARAAGIVGPQRTLGTVIGWSASADGPGRYRVTSAGRFTLGPFSEAAEAKVPMARDILGRAARTKVTLNLAGARWTKLAFNCAMSTIGTVAGITLGDIAGSANTRLLAMRVVAEVIEVARAHGVKLAPASGPLPASFFGEPPDAPLPAKLLRPLRHAAMWAACQPHRRQRSGMLARLEAGRPAGQIDDLNGAVADAARKIGRPAPLNERMTELVHAIERGEERIGRHHVGRLLAQVS